jgi:hypothetical protein
MNKLIVAVLLALATMASAATVSYTAVSKKSQKEADQLAMDGLAKQLRSRVESEFAVTKTEDAAGNISESVLSKKKVSTDIVIKGAKIIHGPKQDGMFQATASVDTEQMASKIRVDLAAVQDKMKELDPIIRKDILNGDYRKMTTDMIAFEKLADEYAFNLENLSCLQKIPPELKLETAMGKLVDFVVTNLSTVKMETDLTSEALMVTITDVAGPVEAFPIALTQDNKDLAHEKTNASGEAVFSLAQVKKRKPTGEVTVHAELNFKYVRTANFITQTVSYASGKSSCTFQFVCDGPAEACGALQKYLNDSGLPTLDKPGLPKLSAKLTFSDKFNSGKTLCTSRVTATLESGKVQLTENAQGVGRDADAAQSKAVQKLPATKIFDAFTKACK